MPGQGRCGAGRNRAPGCGRAITCPMITDVVPAAAATSAAAAQPPGAAGATPTVAMAKTRNSAGLGNQP